MSNIHPYIATYFPYIAPPLIGAFIGYLTNKIAIKMLFRPLNAWKVAGIRLPMTPGVIPSKRHELAVNIGRMVGGHLLTSREISRALEKESFQGHLGELIKERVGAVLERDLPPLHELIPQQYGNYFDNAVENITYHCKRQIENFLDSPECEQLVGRAVMEGCDELLGRDIESLLNREKRENIYIHIEQLIQKMLASRFTELWLEDFLFAQVTKILKNDKSLEDILPSQICDFIIRIVETKTPDILEKIAEITKDPDVQQRIIAAIKKAVDSFASSLGPMGGMVQNFLSMETLEKVVKDYLLNNEEDIRRWLQNDEVKERVTQLLAERIRHYLRMPISSFISVRSSDSLRDACRKSGEQVATMMRADSVSPTVSAMLRESLETYIQQSERDVYGQLCDAIGEDATENLKRATATQAIVMVRSPASRNMIDAVVDQMIASLLKKPIGKLAKLMPSGVREGMYDSIRKVSSQMLAAEVPGLVDSLNIEGIVAEKVDSLDLLRLEGLLLSIMEEQFKYINLFGAMLGFLIGTLNVLLLYIL